MGGKERGEESEGQEKIKKKKKEVEKGGKNKCKEKLDWV